jgi:N-acetyl-anhydromuramyl-L-alanine amidase AmpD
VIDREGQIYRFVSDACLARHAGRGSWAGDPQLTDNMNRYAIPPENILTHHQYDPGRKWDPGELFDWEQLRLEKARP